jgi:membrane fusion protein (multidrug efflux system)
VEDNQQVAAGELLARIDPRDYQAEVDRATAALEMAIAQERSANVTVRLTGDTVRTGIESAVAAEAASESDLVRSQKSFEQTATATLNAAQAAMEAKRAVNVRAQADLARYQPLLVSADVSKMQFDAVQASAQVAASEFVLAQEKLAEARAQTDAAVAQVNKSKAIVRQSEALRQQIEERDAQHRSSLATVEHAKAQLDLAKLQLSYTEIRAPISGVVTQRNVQLGDQVSPGQLLLTIVPLDQIYVTANFKETQLAHMHSGQRAVIRADMYGDLQFEGTVNSISGAAGSRQALLPPQNATGNFVKVVQRIPVKILVTRSSRTDALLRPGTNVKATVYVH